MDRKLWRRGLMALGWHPCQGHSTGRAGGREARCPVKERKPRLGLGPVLRPPCSSSEPSASGNSAHLQRHPGRYQEGGRTCWSGRVLAGRRQEPSGDWEQGQSPGGLGTSGPGEAVT